MKPLRRLAGPSALALLLASPALAFDLNSSTIPGRVPGNVGWVAPLTNGEIAINRADKRLIFKNVDGTLGYGSLLNAVTAGRQAVEQGQADALTVGGVALPSVLGTKAPLANPIFTGTATAPALAITGSGSIGAVDGMNVTLPSGPAQTLQQLLKYRVRNWTEFGAGACQGNAVADTAAFKAAFAAGGRLTLKCDQPILLNDGAVATTFVFLEGESQAAELRLTAAFPQTSDVLTLRPGPGVNFGWRVAGLKVVPQVNGRGRHGIVVDLSPGGGQLTGFLVEHNQVGDVVAVADGFQSMGGAAFRFIPHPTQADQFYVSTIRQNYFVGGAGFTDAQGNVVPGGGIYMRRTGDSLHVDENWIKGPGRAIDVEFVLGAANPTFQRNNITASGGAFRLRSVLRGALEDNQIEHLTAWTGDTDRALVVVSDTDGLVIDKNNINGDLGDHSANLTTDGISLLGTTARVDIRSGNRIVANAAAGRVHLRTASTVTATTFAAGQRIENPYLTISTRQADVLATAIATLGSVRGVWFPLTLLNGWVGQTTAGATYEGLFAKINPDGHVSMRGNLTPGTLTAATSIAILPSDAIPAKTMRMFPKQAQSTSSYLPVGFQLTNAGSLNLTYALPTTAPVSFDDISYNPTSN